MIKTFYLNNYSPMSMQILGEFFPGRIISKSGDTIEGKGVHQ